MNRNFVDIHILQSVPPSNLNRDDTGSPKTATYGGVQRARVSSQAWKRATRQAFSELLDTRDLGLRTKRVVEAVAAQICKNGTGINESQALAAAKAVLESAGIKISVPKGKAGATEEAGYLIFLSNQQIHGLADLAIVAAANGDKPDKNAAQALLRGKNSIDLALFGRMVANVNDLNVDASCQVAHAISTHPVQVEFDYFTAVDDQKAATAEEDAGAGMIGTVEFNSATLYRYATIDVNLLQKNLGDNEATKRAVHAFLEAFVRSMPSGKQNTFANRTLPEAVVITIRNDQPVSYVGAFENAVQASSFSGYAAKSAEKLARYADQIAKSYGSDAIEKSWIIATGDDIAKSLHILGSQVSLPTAIDEATKYVGGCLSEASESR